MKSTFLPAVLATVIASCAVQAHAQYKAPSQYFRKDSPGVGGNGAPAQGAPGTPGSPARPAATEKPKFKDVAVNSQFYFLNDTNRSFPWTKVTATTAKNSKGVTRALPTELLIQR